MQLQMFFKGEDRNLFSIDLYSELKALSLSFYVKLQFQISLGFFDFSFEFYILNIPLIAYINEFHKIRYYEYKDSKELKEKCQEITIKGWTSIFMSKEEKDKNKKIVPCKKYYEFNIN